MASQISVLVIEDEKHICEIIKYNLGMEDFTVQLAQDYLWSRKSLKCTKDKSG